MILWLVALRAEAAPLIAHRGLTAHPRSTPWPLYTSAEGDVAAVISGVGRTNAAAACGWLGGYLRPPPHAAWINVGIAGHSRGPVGRTLVADRVVEQATGRAWYPPGVPRVTLDSDTVRTVDEPESDYAKPGAYDMEASGFLAAAGRWASVELVQVLKVVSDTPSAPAARLDRAIVGDLIAARLDEIDTLAEAMAVLSSGRSSAITTGQ